MKYKLDWSFLLAYIGLYFAAIYTIRILWFMIVGRDLSATLGNVGGMIFPLALAFTIYSGLSYYRHKKSEKKKDKDFKSFISKKY